MNIFKNIKVPTGNILIVEGEKGKLECLSIGDVGRGFDRLDGEGVGFLPPGY